MSRSGASVGTDGSELSGLSSRPSHQFRVIDDDSCRVARGRQTERLGTGTTRILGLCWNGGSSRSDSDGAGSIPAIPDARNRDVPMLPCHERLDAASSPDREQVRWPRARRTDGPCQTE